MHVAASTCPLQTHFSDAIENCDSREKETAVVCRRISVCLGVGWRGCEGKRTGWESGSHGEGVIQKCNRDVSIRWKRRGKPFYQKEKGYRNLLLLASTHSASRQISDVGA